MLSLGLGLGLATRRRSAARPAYARLADYLASLPVAAARSAGLLWQDHDRTTRATAANDPVRVGQDPYSGVVFECASDGVRATIQTDGLGRWWLQNLTGASPYTATLGG